MMKPKVVLLIFVSGKIVLTGAKVREEIYMAFNNIYSVLVGECCNDFSPDFTEGSFGLLAQFVMENASPRDRER
jgi:hypothetical protein